MSKSVSRFKSNASNASQASGKSENDSPSAGTETMNFGAIFEKTRSCSKSSSSSDGNIKVCIRARPLNKMEKAAMEDGTGKVCIQMPTESTLVVADAQGNQKKFDYDRTFWSVDESDGNYCDQTTVVEEVGAELKENALDAYNCCLFAYGQTGSGKTFSVVGNKEQPGLLPVTVAEIFKFIEDEKSNTQDPSTFRCTCSYVEIYNEQFRDLLATPAEKGQQPNLQVHQNPQHGTYIEGLKEVPVFDPAGVDALLEFGVKARTIGATCMNAQSSRSHCIFCLEIIRKRQKSTTHSKLNLVDLAGSERQAKTQASGDRLKEGSMINKSLSCLAQVIHKLAEVSEGRGKKAANQHVPFRDSKLTYALQDSLSGNSKTIMMTAISPSLFNYDETLSTLRFAESVKKIKTKAKKNEHNEEKLVNALQAECERLRKLVEAGDASGSHQQDLSAHEAAIAKYGQDFETQLEVARDLEKQRHEFLEDSGLTMSEVMESVGLDKSTPQLVNVSSDPMLAGCLFYFLKLGEATALGSDKACKIVINGLGMKPKMAEITNTGNTSLSILGIEGRIVVNGQVLAQDNQRELRHGDRLIIGHSFHFRVVIPLSGDPDAEAKEAHEIEQELAEIIPENTEAYQECHQYAADLQSKKGWMAAKTFLSTFRKAHRLVDEANTITQELRPRDGLSFAVEVISNPFHYLEDNPECVVRLKKEEKGLKAASLKIMAIGRKKSGMEGIIDRLGETISSGKGASDVKTINIWDLTAFDDVMVHLRAAYEQDHNYGQGPDGLDLTKPEQDPWLQISPWELPALFQEKNIASAIQGAQAQVQGMDAQQLAEANRAKDERIRELEQQVEMLKSRSGGIARSDASVADSVFGASPNVGFGSSMFSNEAKGPLSPDVRSMRAAMPIDSRLKQAGEETVAAAQLATKLLETLRDIKVGSSFPRGQR